MQYGGWYKNPANGKTQRWFNGVWTDGAEPGGAGGGSNPLDLYNTYSNDLNNNLNKYTDQQIGFSQTGHDLTSNQLNTQNTQALGTQPVADRSAFLSSILTPEQQQLGSLQYGYKINQGHEDNTYINNLNANNQNRDLAINKLNNDEKWAMANIGVQQGNQNQQTIEDLNGRGLLYGQTPTGGLQPTALGGMQGVAAQNANPINAYFNNQRGQTQQNFGLNTQGVNLNHDQTALQQAENHNFAGQTNAFNTSNDINQQNTNFTYQAGQNDNQLAIAKAAAEQQKAQQSIQNKITAQSIAARQGGITY